MSLRYRDSSGNETIVSGLTPGGDIEAGAVAQRTGLIEFTEDTPTGVKIVDITFDSPMPDADYEVQLSLYGNIPHDFGLCSIDYWNEPTHKTANGFTFLFYNGTGSTIASRMKFKYTATKTYTVQHAAQNAEDIINIKAVIPSTASSTNKLATSNDVTTLATDTDSRLDNLEDLVPTGASVTNQLATKDNIDTVTANANSRLKVVDIIPSTPANNDVILYTGTETGFRKGGIYQYVATSGTWVLISTADVDLSHYETSFTGTTAEWNALSSTEQNKYDLVSLTDDEQTGEDNYSTTEQRIGTWIDGKPLYKITVSTTLNAVSTAQAQSTSISLASLNIKQVIGWEGITHYSAASNPSTQYDMDLIRSYTDPSTYVQDVYYQYNGKLINIVSGSVYYSYNRTYYITIKYTKTTD